MKIYGILLLSFYLLVRFVNCQFGNVFGPQGFGFPNLNQFGFSGNQQPNWFQPQAGNQQMNQSPQQNTQFQPYTSPYNQFGFNPGNSQPNWLQPQAGNQQMNQSPQQNTQSQPQQNTQFQPYISPYNQFGFNPFSFKIPQPNQYSQNSNQNPQNFNQNPQNFNQNPQSSNQNSPHSNNGGSQHLQTTNKISEPLSSGKRVSEQKCEEYSSLVTEKVAAGGLLTAPVEMTISVESCSTSQGLIVGGEDAKDAEFPHMAAIGYRTLENEIKFSCGGSLISKRHVLTATHCKSSGRDKAEIVRLGYLNLNLKESHGQDINIDDFIIHERYDSFSKKNDIAVIKLAADVRFNKYVRPACLSTATSFASNRHIVATGWGFIDSTRMTRSDVLQKVTLKIFENGHSACSEFDLDNTQMCAGDTSGKKDTCQGDSGGPLQVVSETNKCVYEIIAVTSFGGALCAQQNTAGVYTRISSYLDWIEQKVWG